MTATDEQPIDSDVGADDGASAHPVSRARCRRLRSALVKLAATGQTASYSSIAADIGLDMQRRGDRTIIGRLLDEIDLAEHAAGRPQLSAVVILKRAGHPSRGFFAISRRLGRQGAMSDLMYWQDELRHVYDHWASA